MKERAPVRHLAHTGWQQVLLNSPEAWITCKTEDHARLIARCQQLDHAVRNDGLRGDDTANERDASAQALVVNRGANLAVNQLLDLSRIARGR
jgi:hypothetical protein